MAQAAARVGTQMAAARTDDGTSLLKRAWGGLANAHRRSRELEGLRRGLAVAQVGRETGVKGL